MIRSKAPGGPAQVLGALRRAGLGDVAQELVALARPSVILSARFTDESRMRIGASKLGGSPDLPRDGAWPRRGKVPLAFLAQVDLGRMPRLPGVVLPEAGTLFFFYDAASEPTGLFPDDRGCLVPGLMETSKPGRTGSHAGTEEVPR